MIKFLLVVLTLTLFSCNRRHELVDATPQWDKDTLVASLTEPQKQHRTQVFHFLGHTLDRRNDLSREFARICREDRNLTFDSITKNVTIYGTTFRLNYKDHEEGFLLVSSVQPDNPKIKRVRDAISKFHGKENFEEEAHYSWLPFTDATTEGQNLPIIHLRRVRSEEGGMIILIR